jgi:hypothetical protein
MARPISGGEVQSEVSPIDDEIAEINVAMLDSELSQYKRQKLCRKSIVLNVKKMFGGV